MGPLDYMTLPLKRYAEFTGRSRRMEYWMFYVGVIVAIFVAAMIDAILGFPILIFIVGLGSIIPSIAVAVRRLHDQDKSGWFLLLGLIPLAGIVLLVFYFLEGTKGDNQYGPDPKA